MGPCGSSNDAMGAGMSSGMKLEPFTISYFDCFGRTEPVRIMLNHKGIKFTDDRFGFDEWPKLKGPKFGGKSVPVLTCASGE